MSLRTPRWGMPAFEIGEHDPVRIYRQALAEYGRNLSDADPRALVLRSFSTVLAQSNISIDEGIKGALLPYAEGEELDFWGEAYDAQRLPAAAASVVVTFTLSATRAIPTSIAEGTRVAAGNIVFETQSELKIEAGQLSGEVRATALEAGDAGNNVLAGEVDTLVDQNNPYIDTVSNASAATGGAEVESDDAYAERLRLLPDSFSVGGPINAYEYFARAWSPAVTDVYVSTPERRVEVGDAPEPGVVRVFALVNGLPISGNFPRVPSDAQTDAADLYAFLSGEKRRPDTDGLFVESPEQVARSWHFEWYPEPNDERGSAEIQDAVDAEVLRFIEWQDGAIGRGINPDELIRRLRNNAGVQYIEEAVSSADAMQFEAIDPRKVPLMTITSEIGS